jgi:hypothetical protein
MFIHMHICIYTDVPVIASKEAIVDVDVSSQVFVSQEVLSMVEILVTDIMKQDNDLSMPRMSAKMLKQKTLDTVLQKKKDLENLKNLNRISSIGIYEYLYI